jgi:hypothetical protein
LKELDNNPEILPPKIISGRDYYYLKFKELAMYYPYKYTCNDIGFYPITFPHKKEKTRILFASNWSLNHPNANDPNVLGQLTLNRILEKFSSGNVDYFAVGGNLNLDTVIDDKNKDITDHGTEGNRFLQVLKPLTSIIPFMV